MSLFSPTPPRIESTATTFTRGTDALKTLRERRDDFDIVLSDVHMPDMDGFKLLEAVALELQRARDWRQAMEYLGESHH